MNLALFGAGDAVNATVGYVNANTGDITQFDNNHSLAGENKTFYSDYLIDAAEPKLVHDQFAQKHPIPKNRGKKIEFRKYSQLPKMTKPLSEGVTPTGQKLSMSVIETPTEQYGGYIELTDIIDMTAIDNNMVQATKLIGGQAGRTLDTITREELVGGTNVQFGAGNKDARYLLTGGAASGNDYLTVDSIRKAVRTLKVQNAEKIDNYYVGIIHPDCEYDLMSDPEWQYPHQYVDTSNIYNGEIGKIAGVRFVESTEAKVFHAEDLTTGARNLKTASYSGTASDSSATAGIASAYKVTVAETLTEGDGEELVGRKVLIKGAISEIVGVSYASKSIYLKEAPAAAPAANDPIYPGEAGANGRDVYATLIVGDNAYGTTEISGGGLEYITKQLGSAGTSDPLNQRATVGWKATKAAIRLVEEYMVRIETASTFEVGAN